MFLSKAKIFSQESFGTPSANMRLKKMSCSAGFIAHRRLVKSYIELYGPSWLQVGGHSANP